MSAARTFGQSFSKAFALSASVAASATGAVLLATMLAPFSASAAVPSANPTEPTTRPAPIPAAEDSTNSTEEGLTERERIESELTERELAETANYSDGEISIDYPASWQVSVSESGEVSIFDTAADAPHDGSDLPAPPTAPQAVLVETKVFRVATPPGPLVDANIDSFIDEGAAVSRYTSVEIDEQDALVIWLADRPNELSAAIATFIGYGDETIFLFSRYSPENDSAENSILRLHSSFTNLSPNTSSPTLSPSPVEPDRSSRPPSDTAVPSAPLPR